MFLLSSSRARENIPPVTPRPYQPGCSITFEQWQRSEENHVNAIKKRIGNKSKFDNSVHSAFGSMYAADTSTADNYLDKPVRPVFGSSYVANNHCYYLYIFVRFWMQDEFVEVWNVAGLDTKK
jgi:hypothetical protein